MTTAWYVGPALSPLSQLFPYPHQLFHLGCIITAGKAHADMRCAARDEFAEPVDGPRPVARETILLFADFLCGAQVIAFKIRIKLCIRRRLVVMHRQGDIGRPGNRDGSRPASFANFCTPIQPSVQSLPVPAPDGNQPSK